MNAIYCLQSSLISLSVTPPSYFSEPSVLVESAYFNQQMIEQRNLLYVQVTFSN